MSARHPHIGLRVLALMLLGSCAAPSVPRAPASTDKSLLWTQHAAERRAATIGIFASAAAALPELLADGSWTAALEQRPDGVRNKPAAVVVDVDETLLDNSHYQWERAQLGQSFDKASWDAWVQRAEAPALPGAVAYVQRVQELGATVYYVTNRPCQQRSASPGDSCPQAADTARNLVGAGFPPPAPAQLLLKGMRPDWGSEKSTRRAAVAARYRIVQLVGDDLGDFIAGAGDAAEQRRRALVQEHRKAWGRGWFMLPNPMYGSWERALGAR